MSQKHDKGDVREILLSQLNKMNSGHPSYISSKFTLLLGERAKTETPDLVPFQQLSSCKPPDLPWVNSCAWNVNHSTHLPGLPLLLHRWTGASPELSFTRKFESGSEHQAVISYPSQSPSTMEV